MDTPLYSRVHRELQSAILSGVYPRGAMLPSERRLQEQFGVSLITVRRAIRELALDGLVESRHGIGHFVRDPVALPVVVGMSSFASDVASGRLRLVRTLLVDDMVTAVGEVAERLQVQPGSLVRHLVRLDQEGAEPLSIDDAFIPPSLATHITSAMASSPAFTYLWQETAGVVLVRTSYEIWAEAPNEEHQRLLRIGPETPLLISGELIYDEDGFPALWVVSRYRSDRTRLSGVMALGNGAPRQG